MVTYNENGADGGEPPVDARKYEEGDTVTIAGNSRDMVKEGNTFIGWNTKASGDDGKAYTPGETFVMGTRNVTLYARWTTNPVYTVIYLGNSNTAGRAPDPVSNEEDVEITIAGPGTLVKKGHSFTGWNTADDGSGSEYGSNATYTMGDKDDTLYAQWEINRYTVTYDGNGDSVDNLPSHTTHRYNTEMTLDTIVPTRIGYTFFRWNTDATGDGEDYEPGSEFTVGDDDVTFYARWTVNKYTVTYNGNGNTGGSAPDSTKADYNDSVTIAGKESLKRTGYSFSCWNTEANGDGIAYPADTTFLMGAGDMRFFAQWSINRYTVAFFKNSADAEGSMVPQSIPYDSTAHLIDNEFTQEGWSFAGWATAADGEVEYSDGDEYTMGAQYDTLYAQWTVNSYTLSFDKNDDDASGEMDTVTLSYDSTVSLPDNEFSKTGWGFAGWASSADGAVEYGDGDEYTMGAGDDTLYAQWTVNTYTVTYDKNNDDATGDMDPQRIVFGLAESLTANGFERTGYRFDGWATSAGGEVEYEEEAEYTMGAGVVTLYAKWIRRCTVTFNCLGGSSAGSTVVDSGTAVTAPAAPTLQYCTFDTWYTERQCVNAWDFSTNTVVEDTVLYAGYTVTDQDGYTYKTVLIGDQRWMAENLNVKHYNDGSEIPLVESATEWSELARPGYCYYDNDESTYGDTYGALYNWYAVNTGMLAPEGWHVPSDADWDTLAEYLGGADVAGGKLKEAGTAHWQSPNEGATNESGFSAVPGGYRGNGGPFNHIGYRSHWWSATEAVDASRAWRRGLYYDSSDLNNYDGNYKQYGFSIRCLLGTPVFDVKFNSQGGSSVATQKVEKDGYATEPTQPTLDNCTFSGWYTEATCENKWSFGTDAVTAPMTLYAGYTVTDVDGNVYKTILIGNQRWMAENLKATKYDDETTIPRVTTAGDWEALSSPAYCWYDNDSATYHENYGVLYNWYTVADTNSHELAPAGWHVPSDAEWDTLAAYLGGESVAGGKLKESGTSHWNEPNTGATNETGFSALPGGWRDDGGFDFRNQGNNGFWWCFTERDASRAYSTGLLRDYNHLARYYGYSKVCGFSVRLVRD